MSVLSTSLSTSRPPTPPKMNQLDGIQLRVLMVGDGAGLLPEGQPLSRKGSRDLRVILGEKYPRHVQKSSAAQKGESRENTIITQLS